jgi:hypothetical protein
MHPSAATHPGTYGRHPHIIFLRDSFPTLSILRRPFTPIPTFYTTATRNPTDKWPSVTPLRLNPYVKSHGQQPPTNPYLRASLVVTPCRTLISHSHVLSLFLFVTQMICEGSAKALTWPDEWTATTVRRVRLPPCFAYEMWDDPADTCFFSLYTINKQRWTGDGPLNLNIPY